MGGQFDQLAKALGDRYRVERELGQGGMATVYLALDIKHDRQVAVKVLRPDLAAAIGAERFLREVKITARLQNPHILTLIDSGASDGLLYYVMPYVEGESLRDRLEREGELPIDDVVRILKQVVDALATAHAQGVVHRDIKPDNVMLSGGGRHALVTDFGVAKALTESKEDGALTSLGVALGTPMYMAPEQAAGDPQTDHRADLYSVGVMAYEMLAGRPPFKADTPQGLLAAHVSKVPDAVTLYRPGVSPALASFVMKALEKRAADRWQTADEMAAALDAISTTSATTAVVSAEHLAALVRRNQPLRVIVSFAVLAAIVVGVVYALMFALGLPGWVVPVAGALALAGLPVVLITARTERDRAVTLLAATSATPTVPRRWTWSRTRRAGIVAASVFAVTVAVYMAMRLLGIGPVGTLVASGVLAEREHLILAQFENGTSDSTLGETVTELFRIDLAQSPTVTMLEPSQVAPVLQRMARDPATPLTFELAVEVAEREGLKAVVGGEIRSLGNGYVLSARVVAAGSGDLLAAARETASDADGIIRAIDKLSADIRAKIGESLKTIRADAPLAEVTTHSTEALRLYAQADRANNLGDAPRAIRLLEEAVSEDSTFAMGYRKLAIVLTNENQDGPRADSAFATAYRLRDRLTERERYLAEAAYFEYVEDDRDAAVDRYTTLLEKYPDDFIALNNLAVNYRRMGRNDESLALYRRAAHLGGAPAVTLTNLMQVEYVLGNTDSAEAALDLLAKEYPENTSIRTLRASLASARFDYETAESLTNEQRVAYRGNAPIEGQTAFELGSLSGIRGKLSDSHRYFMEGFDIQAERKLGWVSAPRDVFEDLNNAVEAIEFLGDETRIREVLARLRTDAARADLDASYFQQVVVVHAMAGLVAETRELARRYDAKFATGADNNEEGANDLSVRASVARVEGRYDDAIAAMRKVRELLPNCPLCGLEEIAELFDRKGDVDSAIAGYRRYIETPALFRTSADRASLWIAYRRLGALYEQRGDRDLALEYYGRFLDLWADADAVLQPQVEDIRGRVARLAGER